MMQNTKWIKVCLRAVVYLILLVLFFYFYMVEQMSDFFKGRTTLTSRTEKVKDLEPPTTTVCMSPSMKRSVAKQMKFQHVLMGVPNDTTYPKAIAETNYILNRDYELYLGFLNPDDPYTYTNTKLHMGEMKVSRKKFLVDSIVTVGHGTCTKIQPLFSQSRLTVFYLWLKFTSSLLEEDKPNKVHFYFTSNDTWQGVLDDIWTQFKPCKVSVPSDFTFVWFTARTKEFLKDEGVDNSEQCWLEQFEHFNCTMKCQPVTYTSSLPMCNSSEQLGCIAIEIEKKNLYGLCHKKKKGVYFEGEALETDAVLSDDGHNGTMLGFSFAEMSKQIEEEVDVITMPGLIGSVGGSLGMFFGFSISAFVFCLLDKFVKMKWPLAD